MTLRELESKTIEHDDCSMVSIGDAKKVILAIKQAFSDYVRTEGCSCCRDDHGHELAAKKLGEIMGFEKYKDSDSFNFYEPTSANSF